MSHSQELFALKNSLSATCTAGNTGRKVGIRNLPDKPKVVFRNTEAWVTTFFRAQILGRAVHRNCTQNFKDDHSKPKYCMKDFYTSGIGCLIEPHNSKGNKVFRCINLTQTLQELCLCL
jgi:hypothetical protein